MITGDFVASVFVIVAGAVLALYLALGERR